MPQADTAEGDEFDIRELLATLVESRWLIGVTAAVIFCLGLIYALVATPIYRVDALVQVEKDGANSKGLSAITDLLSGDSSSESEIEVLRSRSVLRAAVDELNLDIDVLPRRIPIFGAAIARAYHGDQPADPWLGLSSFAWGGEKLKLDRLKVPEEMENLSLTLLAGSNGNYELLDDDGETLVAGTVGKAAEARGVSIFISQLVARPGTEFRIVKKPLSETLDDLLLNLQVGEKGKKTGVIQVALEGPDRLKAGAIIDAVVNRYLRQNVERRSEDAQRMLEFLNSQMPRVRSEVQSAEAALGDYRARTGSLDVTIEAQSYLTAATEVEQQIALLRLQKAELEQRFTGDHPTLSIVRDKLALLEKEKASVSSRIKSLPGTEVKAVALMRDAKVANEIYTLLLNKTQELAVAKAGTIGNVRILDHAILPAKPVKPKKVLIVAVALVLGLFLGVAIALVRRSLMKGVEDPDEVDRKLGLPVYATIPHSARVETYEREHKKKHRGEKFSRFFLAKEDPKDISMESLRSLRTSLQFALMDASSNIIMITGPSPGIGKSFVSANLAASLAEAGKRVLLIDADMRKGHLHEYFGHKRTYGLSGIISGEVPLDRAVVKTDIENLDFISCGIVPPNPSELLISDHFAGMLADVKELYDVVLIDTPPVLAVTDASVVGRQVGVTFMVLRCGRHHMREIELTYKRLRQNGVKVHGVVFNDTPLGGLGYGYGYSYHYHYEYK